MYTKSSFDTLMKIQEKPAPVNLSQHPASMFEQEHLAIKCRLESVMIRLKKLRDAPWDELQHELRAELFK